MLNHQSITIGFLSIVFLFGLSLLNADFFKSVFGSEEISSDDAVQIAMDFVRSSPTFSFDGIEDSLKLIIIRSFESFPPQYGVTLSFDSAHSGYGDRKNQALAQVLTTHNVQIKVIDGDVVYANFDGVWDELNQEYLSAQPEPKDFPKSNKDTYNKLPSRAILNSTNSIQLGKTVKFDDNQFSLTFSKIIQDSRCPADIICAHQGDATVQVVIGDYEKKLRELELSLNSNEKPLKLLDRYFVKFSDLTPYQLSNEKIKDHEYIATVKITSFNLYSPRVQLEKGLNPSEVMCKFGLSLIQKISKESVVCVTDITSQKLIQRGWGISLGKSNSHSNIISDSTLPFNSIIGLENFKKILAETHDIQPFFQKFGEPHDDIGSGIHIYVYNLNDGTQIWIGYADELVYLRHVDANGTVLEELF